ncbi:hypothetical protein HDU97_003166 [Phlyctochytrium planicorne]|nr:hypothetical protein HDU97_003166 [Phlyctochytrium planicorne]
MSPTSSRSLVVLPTLSKPNPDKYDPLEIRDVKTQWPLPSGHVLVAMKAAALNHRDVFIRQGLYPGIKADSVLGSDGSGVVIASSSDKIREGTKVLLNPSHNWKKDAKAPEKIAEWGIMGLLPFPDHLSFEEAAALPLAGLTAWRATYTKGELKRGQSILISGIGGGVALFALQFAVASGANVYVTSSDKEKIAKAIALGAKGGVNYREKDWPKALERLVGAPNSIDVVVDGAGGSENFKGYLKVLKPGGIISNYGATASSMIEISLPTLFLKHIELRGCTMGNEEEFSEMLEFVAERKIKPVVSKVVDFENFEEAFNTMSQQFGKIVLRISSKL